jgi:hypothetical protein
MRIQSFRMVTLLVLIIFSFVTVLPNSARAVFIVPRTVNAPSNWGHYTNLPYKISIAIPPNWFIFKRNTGNIAVDLRNEPFALAAGYAISIIPPITDYYTISDYNNFRSGTAAANEMMATNYILYKYMNFLKKNAPGFSMIGQLPYNLANDMTLNYLRTISPGNIKVLSSDHLVIRADHNLEIYSTYVDARTPSTSPVLKTLGDIWGYTKDAIPPEIFGRYKDTSSFVTHNDTESMEDYCNKNSITFNSCFKTMEDIETLKHCTTMASIWAMNYAPHYETYDTRCHTYH